MSGTVYHASGTAGGTETPAFAYEWQDQISQSGLKEALAWRDDPYKELAMYKK